MNEPLAFIQYRNGWLRGRLNLRGRCKGRELDPTPLCRVYKTEHRSKPIPRYCRCEICTAPPDLALPRGRSPRFAGFILLAAWQHANDYISTGKFVLLQ